MKTQYIGESSVTKIEEYIDTLDPNFVFKNFSSSIIDDNKKWLFPNYIDKNSLLLYFSFHSFLIETPKHRILIDTCIGNNKIRPLPNWNMRDGKFLKNFEKFNLDRNDIDYVMCTHLHADHVGWNTMLSNGKWVPTFPKAKYIFSKKDYDFFNNVKEGEQGYLSMIDSVRPIVDHGQATLVDDNYTIDNYIDLIPTPGHTPGHICIKLNSKEKNGIFTGDLIHHPILISEPSIETNFCYDPKLAVMARKKFIDKNIDTNTIIFPAHFSGSTAGYIKSSTYGNIFKSAKL